MDGPLRCLALRYNKLWLVSRKWEIREREKRRAVLCAMSEYTTEAVEICLPRFRELDGENVKC